MKNNTCCNQKIITPDLHKLTYGMDLRVMTSNILAERWTFGNRPQIEERARMYGEILKAYHPDIVGVQESDAPWKECFPKYLDSAREKTGKNYRWILNSFGDVANMTSIIYDEDKFELVESSSKEYSYVNHTLYKIRMMSLAVFKVKESGKIIVHINTHWGFAKDLENRKTEISEESALVAKMLEKYKGCSVFCTGDFNMHGNTGFEEFKKLSGLKDSKEVAKVSGTLANEVIGVPPANTGNFYIDHVFINDGVKVGRYETVEESWENMMSDHMPQYGDFKLK